MRVDVVGPGAVGGSLAVLLYEAGADVAVVGRASVQRSPSPVRFSLRTPQGLHEATLPLGARTRPDADLVLLCVKTQDVSAACTRISKGPGTVLVLANGLAADTLAATLLGDRRITPGVLFLEATMREPGQIDLRGRIQIAVPLGAAAETDELGRACTIERRRDFEGVRWTKLIANLQNGLNAALGTPLQESLRGAGGALAVDLFREGMDVAAAAHVPLAPTPVLDPGTAWFLRHAPRPVAVAALRRSVRRTFGDRAIPGSTLQSLWRGKPTEVRWLNGAIAHEGRRRGVATPLNDAIVAAVESVEQGGAFTTADAVRDRIRRAGPP